MPLRGDLSAAHRGYAYQDLVAAIAFAEMLVSFTGSITVDRKAVEGDRFDDLVVRGRNGTVRRQIKWSAGGARRLELSDFVGAGSSLRIDHLVLSSLKTNGGETNHECRLSVTWDSATDPALCAVLRESDDSATVPGARSRRFRLLPERIWPAEERPMWRPLCDTGAIDREGFLSFVEFFVLETEMPGFSADLSTPGEIEQVLLRLLVEQIGIGEYPNERRNPEDVAARLIALATWARTAHATLTAGEVAQAIDLRIDYGHVPQRFPIDTDHRIDRDHFRSLLRRGIEEAPIVVVVGPPGAGKSWELSALADELREQGVLVTRHYCYLEPGDPDVERRITTNALFGNLVSELLSSDPELAEAKQRTYAATRDELERVLRAAAEKYAPEPVVLIVDGIDHISRVLAESRGVAAADTDIVEELAALSLPPGVRLVLGSQPGPHLEPLQAVSREIRMPPWGDEEVWALAKRFNLLGQLSVVEDLTALRARFSARADGNPLYATFLIRGLIEEIRHGAATPAEWLETAPPIQGNIANYYAHLYGGAGPDVRIVAEVLGVIDFAVTEAELGTVIGPLVAEHLQRALRRLRPILIEVAGQGGLRMFHESFRRFIVERLRAEGRSIGVPLALVIDWLKALGFAEDARAYRYLLPALRRAGRTEELLEQVGPDFVSTGVSWGHPREAIMRNLSLATEVAADAECWPQLVRCSELHRALHTCYEEHLLDPVHYWRVFLSVFGPETTVGRLVFDGHPTLGRHLGLVLCSLLDDAGSVVPWDEYMALPLQPFTERVGRQVDTPWVGQVIAALVHGRLRRRGVEATLKWVREELLARRDLEAPVLRAVTERLARSIPAESLEALLQDDSIPFNHRAAVVLARARRRKREGNLVQAAADAELGVRLAPSMELAEEALALGATALPEDLAIPDPCGIDIGLVGDRYHVEESAIARWVSAVAVLAYRNPGPLDRLVEHVTGEGWYRSWLRYVLQISKAEVLARTDPVAASSMAVNAFGELANNAHPFTGQPRATDLVMIRGRILGTLARGFAVLSGEWAWSAALKALEQAIGGTAAHLQRSPSGPILRESVAELLEPYCESRPELKEHIREAVEAQIRAAEQAGEYFANHADIEFSAVRALVAIGDRERALEHWRQAAVYLGAYGQRKDVTLYELLEPLPALDDPTRLDALERLFPLAKAVVIHTDGKETRHLPNACVRQLAAVDPPAALALAARSQVSDGGTYGWRVEEATHAAIDATRKHAAPALVALADNTFRFDVDYDPRALSEVTLRLAPIERLSGIDPSAAVVALRQLAARVEGDHRHELLAAWPSITGLAARIGARLTEPTSVVGPAGEAPESPSARRPHYGSIRHETILKAVAPSPLPPAEATPLQLMAWVREIARPRIDEPDRGYHDDLVNRTGFACVGMAQGEREDAAIRLLHFVARELPTFGMQGATPLADLGAGFARYGLLRLAAVAYALAFAHSRGGGGWDSFGGDEHAGWLDQALTFNADEARHALAAEVVRLVQGGYVTGVTPGVIKSVASWGDAVAARACWDEAYRVVRYRLPTQSRAGTALLPFSRAEAEPWSMDQALVGVIIARVSHPELDRKRSALLSFASVVKAHPDLVAVPLGRLLTIDGTPTSTLLLLLVLLHSEESPYPISRALSCTLKLIATSDHYGERTIARMLLRRTGQPEMHGGGPNSPYFDRPAERRHIRLALALDWGKRVEAVSSLWPDFPAILARRFEQLHFESEASQRRCRHRYEYASRQESTKEFWTPVLFWEREVFETAFHEALNGVRPYLWSQGKSTIGFDEELLDRIAPQIRLQLAVDASRSVRPAVPRPAETVPMEGAVPVLAVDGQFQNWRRLGWSERELVFQNPTMRYGNPTEIVHVAGGVVATAPGERWDSSPFRQCDPNVWFFPNRPAGLAEPTVALLGFHGPIVGAARLDDLLGDRLVLTPLQALAARYGLTPGPWPGPLIWADDTESPAVAFRMWRVRSIETGSEEPSILEGCELLARPDVFERIERDACNVLVFVTRPWRRAIPTRRVPSS